jgi:hypothetical protein
MERWFMKGGFEVTHAVVVCVNIPRTSGGAEKTTSTVTVFMIAGFRV